MKILIYDLSTGRLTQNVIAPNQLRIYLGQIQMLIGKCTNYLTSYIRRKYLWHHFKFLATNTFMHNKMFVNLNEVPLLDAASALELYTVCILPIVNPNTDMSAKYRWFKICYTIWNSLHLMHYGKLSFSYTFGSVS